MGSFGASPERSPGLQMQWKNCEPPLFLCSDVLQVLATLRCVVLEAAIRAKFYTPISEARAHGIIGRLGETSLPFPPKLTPKAEGGRLGRKTATSFLLFF